MCCCIVVVLAVIPVVVVVVVVFFFFVMLMNCRGLLYKAMCRLQEYKKIRKKKKQLENVVGVAFPFDEKQKMSVFPSTESTHTVLCLIFNFLFFIFSLLPSFLLLLLHSFSSSLALYIYEVLSTTYEVGRCASMYPLVF